LRFNAHRPWEFSAEAGSTNESAPTVMTYFK
jgi:hypothetical protein